MGDRRPIIMDRSSARRAVVALLLVGTLLMGVSGWASATTASPRGPIHPTAGVDELTVTVGTAFAFTLDTSQVTPGDTVNLTVVQTATSTHTFTLSSVKNYSLDPNTNTTAQVNAFFTAHPPLVNITIPDVPGEIHTSFVAPPLGVYQYVCLAVGHFQAGMQGLLGSGVAPPSSTSNMGPGAPVFIITGTIVGLVVIAIVLGFVIGRRRGSSEEMPPERLGYAEPSGPVEPQK